MDGSALASPLEVCTVAADFKDPLLIRSWLDEFVNFEIQFTPYSKYSSNLTLTLNERCYKSELKSIAL